MRADEAPRDRRARPRNAAHSGDDERRGARGRRRADVGDEIADREVGFVADTRTIGSADSNTARATISSLNAHRSSSEPPPRHTISTSTSACRFASRIAAAISLRAPAPCTDAGYRITGRPRKRRRSVVSTSRNAAAWRDVTMPMRRGNGGSGRLRAASNRPAAASARLQLHEALVQRAEARQANGFDVELEFTARLVDRGRRAHFDGEPFAQRERQPLRLVPEEHAAHLRAAASLSVK